MSSTRSTNPSAAPPAVPLLDLRAQYEQLREELLQAVTEVLDSQQCVNGPAIADFEARAAEYGGTAHAIAVSSGTDALLCSLMALEIGAGDEVITPAFTFFATAGSIHRCGATPVFADVDPTTFNITPEAIEAAITDRTRAIMPVHLFGQMAPMASIRAIADRHNLAIVEDAAQAIGATQHGQAAGTVGEFGCFSFFPTKNLGGLGDGGLIVTDDQALAERCRSLRNHGQSRRYYHDSVGGNFRMDTIQAAYLSVKLAHLDRWSEARRANAAHYGAKLRSVEGIACPSVAEGNVSIFNQYVIRAADRDALKQYLADHQIGSAVYYPLPLHQQPCFASLGYQPGDFPQAERAAKEVLALPIFPELTRQQLDHVAETICSFYCHA